MKILNHENNNADAFSTKKANAQSTKHRVKIYIYISWLKDTKPSFSLSSGTYSVTNTMTDTQYAKMARQSFLCSNILYICGFPG